jgi:hypothetical protein
MMSGTEILKLVGSILGVVAFVWNVWTSARSYLVLTMEIRNPADAAGPILRVTAANSGVVSKMISYAVVLIAPESMVLADALEKILGEKLTSSTGLRRRRNAVVRMFRNAGDTARYSGDCALLPLPEMYRDQAMVGPGEIVSYAFSIDGSKLKANETYIARFLVFILYPGSFLRWRFTADAFRMSSNSCFLPNLDLSTGKAPHP